MQGNKKLPNFNKNDYKKAYKSLEEFCKKNTDAKLIGAFGEVKEPPISDLDVFICLGDDNFIKDKNKIDTFISNDKILLYTVEHDPVIIPLSILSKFKYFHTSYNLHFTHNVINYEQKKITEDYEKMLNLFWALTIISRTINLNSDKDNYYSIRKQLLLLKNLHQSADNLMNEINPIEANFLKTTTSLRKKNLSNNLSNLSTDITKEMLQTRNKMLLMLDKIDLNYFQLENVNSVKIKKLRLNREFCIKQHSTTQYNRNKNLTCLTLNKKLYKIIYDIYFHKTNSPIINQFVNAGDELTKTCNKLQINLQLPSPFGIKLGNLKAKDYAKKIILNLLNIFS